MSNIIFTLVSRGFGWNLMREIFTSLDGAIFSLFSAIIQLMFDIVKVTASSDFFESIQSRIYVILSIYMLFKVTISLITYVVNPDSMSDKGQGVGKLVQRIMVSMVMLIIFPTVFTKLMNYQSDIIEDHTIDNIILGSKSINDQQNAGDAIGTAVYDGFIIRPRDVELSNTTETIGLTKVSDASNIVNDPISADQKDVYKYEYVPLIGFALGVFMTLLILSFCIDLAIRVFKLIILQLIAPIPIISYIDPKSSKDGAFSKWLKMVMTTWGSLFVRLIVIDFILLVIKELIMTDVLNQSGGIMVKIALIVGLLFFAKNLPKFIGDALGIKIEGGLFSGLGQIAAAGAIGLGAVGAGVGIAASGITADKARGKLNGLNVAKNIGAGLFGVAGGLGASALAVGKAKDNYGKAAMDARNKYLANQLSGNTAAKRAFGTLSSLATGYDIDREISRFGAIEASGNKLRGYVNAEGGKKFSNDKMMLGTDMGGFHNFKDANGKTFNNLELSRNDFKLALADSVNHNGHVIYTTADGTEVDFGAADGSMAGKLSGDFEEFCGDKYMDAVNAGTISDPGAYDKLITSYANAMGISTKEAKTHRNKSIKINEKDSATRKFGLEQKKGKKK